MNESMTSENSASARQEEKRGLLRQGHGKAGRRLVIGGRNSSAFGERRREVSGGEKNIYGYRLLVGVVNVIPKSSYVFCAIWVCKACVDQGVGERMWFVFEMGLVTWGLDVSEFWWVGVDDEVREGK
jgi:hypothetical protein